MDIIDKVIEELKEKTKREYIKLNTEVSENMTQFDSKFGGIPYIPNNFEYPYSRKDTKQPLKLLAQINFSDAPEIEEFSHMKGMLQIYFDPSDDMYGWDYNNYSNQDRFRVIYHKEIDKNADNSDKIPEIKCKEMYTPVDRDLKISFEKSYDFISYTMGCFDEVFSEVYNKYSDENVESVLDLDDEISEYFYEKWNYEGHKIGGYSNYTQYEDQPEEYSVQLLQIDSDFKGGEYGPCICWGDAGIGHFFIKPENLKNLDFSDVAYQWDCC